MIVHSLRAKLAMAFSVVALALLALAALAVAELRRLEQQIQVERTTTALFDQVREVRNRENRLFLFGRPEDFIELDEDVAHAIEALDRSRARLTPLAQDRLLAEFRTALVEYQERIHIYWQNSAQRATAPELAAQPLRVVRRRFVDIAETLSENAQAKVASALSEHRQRLGAGIAALVLLMAFVAYFLIRGIVRPLKSIESQMGQVAEGAIGRVDFASRDLELTALGRAFNHVMSELEHRQKRALQTEKLVSLGTMLSGVAHELNNPLSNISTTVQIIGEEIEQLSKVELAHLIERVDLQTERARSIVRDLLEYARADLAPAELVDVRLVIKHAIEAINHGRAAPRRIMSDCEGRLEVRGKADRLQRVLINLLGNAIDATGEDEPIVVCARSTRDANLSEEVIIHVQDCGSGMTPEQAAHLFDPFYTTKPVGQGTGLGLFIAHEIVKQHGGAIEVVSNALSGSSLMVKIPSGVKAAA